MNELKNRGVDDIMLAVVDGLKGFPDAITALEWGRLYPPLAKAGGERGVRSFPSWPSPKPCADHLYDECHRGTELEAPARRQGQGTLPQRRCRDQAALSDLDPIHGQGPVCRYL